MAFMVCLVCNKCSKPRYEVKVIPSFCSDIIIQIVLITNWYHVGTMEAAEGTFQCCIDKAVFFPATTNPPAIEFDCFPISPSIINIIKFLSEELAVSRSLPQQELVQ
mmetsp:Transcript_22079/g.37866  ORF Transcript_22079/g.37866 Transcript_22079/m.37866 type:complete len:107 (-) Transcript_22079:1885-2205(-)